MRHAILSSVLAGASVSTLLAQVLRVEEAVVVAKETDP